MKLSVLLAASAASGVLALGFKSKRQETYQTTGIPLVDEFSKWPLETMEQLANNVNFGEINQVIGVSRKSDGLPALNLIKGTGGSTVALINGTFTEVASSVKVTGESLTNVLWPASRHKRQLFGGSDGNGVGDLTIPKIPIASTIPLPINPIADFVQRTGASIQQITNHVDASGGSIFSVLSTTSNQTFALVAGNVVEISEVISLSLQPIRQSLCGIFPQGSSSSSSSSAGLRTKRETSQESPPVIAKRQDDDSDNDLPNLLELGGSMRPPSAGSPNHALYREIALEANSGVKVNLNEIVGVPKNKGDPIDIFVQVGRDEADLENQGIMASVNGNILTVTDSVKLEVVNPKNIFF
ncbi:hypothetical protein V8F20_008773 [Naviculisporaceae sp. PSN 640]